MPYEIRLTIEKYKIQIKKIKLFLLPDNGFRAKVMINTRKI